LLVGDRYNTIGDWQSDSWLSIWMFWIDPSNDLAGKNLC
jgi:hypothetical protein